MVDRLEVAANPGAVAGACPAGVPEDLPAGVISHLCVVVFCRWIGFKW